MAKFYHQIDQASSIRPVRYYFAYGMNTNIGEMDYRCPDAIFIGSGRIKNHKLAFRTHADIEQSNNDEILGVVWQITNDCERNLDMLEGYPFYYDKVEFIVALDNPYKNMTHVMAMAYQMVNQQGYFPPGERYKQCLIDGYTSHNVDVDQIYKALEESYNYDTVRN